MPKRIIEKTFYHGFIVGDRVRINKPDYNYHDFLGNITEVPQEDNNKLFRVRVDNYPCRNPNGILLFEHEFTRAE